MLPRPVGARADDRYGEEDGMNGISLRKTTPADVPALAAVLEGLPEWFSAIEVQTLREVAGSLSGLAAVEDDAAVVGFVIWEQRPDEWEIRWIGVVSRLHRRGIGRLLITRMLERLRATGVHRVRVKTVAATEDYEPYARTRRFYEAFGFQLDTVRPHGWPDGTDLAEYVLTEP
jgi:GNAT superfamily N-acetyltransferase